MKHFKSFVNNNKKVQRIIWSFLFSLMITGLSSMITSIITLNLPLVATFILIVIINYLLNEDVKVEL